MSLSVAMKTIGLCSMYIFLSCLLIRFNKHLMHKERFPFAVVLTTIHMSMTTLLCYILYFIKPSLYPAMASLGGQRMTMVKYFIPLGLLFAVSLACSNQAYLYSSVAFLQFVKEGSVVLIFFLGCLFGMQRCTRSKFLVLAWILSGACMAVHGDMYFVMFGLLIQLCALVCESCKTVLGEWMMKGEMKLDPLTFTMFMAPVSLCFLLVASVVMWEHAIVAQFIEFWPLLLPNSCLAFMLNCSVAVLIKECSAMTLILAGLVKDMVLVVACVFMFNETVTLWQFLGFAVCLGGIGFWSLMLLDPNSAPVKILKQWLGEMPQAEKSELQPLDGKKALLV